MAAARRATPKAKSYYRGLRVTLTQSPDSRVCLVGVSTKAAEAPWEDWNLLFPAIRVPAREVNGYESVLRLLVDTIEGLLLADKKFE